MKYKLWIFSLFLLPVSTVNGQIDSLGNLDPDIGGLFYLDSIVVKASRTGFDLEDFVAMVQEDTSFYKSFRQLRFTEYHGKHDLEMYNKKGQVKSHYRSELNQEVDGLCRSVKLIQEDYADNFYKRKKKHRFYTGRLLHALFQSAACETQYAGDPNAQSEGRLGKHISELKKLIFSPGQKADVPMIGGKTAIFEKKMAPYYNFSITSESYKGAIDCYVFKAQLKPEYQVKKQDKTVVKYLETYFNKSNFAIVARNYHLAYYSALYDFDVKMSIECREFGESFLPSKISYDGFWDIPGRKPEVGKFTILIEDPRLP